MSKMNMPQQFGKYVLLRAIAKGGMAEIFKAKTAGAEGFEKELVIKRILPHYSEDESFVKMFIDEATITSKLQHANIVQIFDFDQADKSYYIAMEYVEGVDLKVVVDRARKEGNPLSVAQVAWIIMELCKGLHYAHTREVKGKPLNIVHRDISPHNAMVSFNGEVKLMDFGIAKAAQRSTKTMAGTVKGKVAYMSPEQARGKPLDGRSDLYAVGIMMWEMLTGKRLFLGDSDFETLTNVLKMEAPAPSTINPDVPPKLDLIILKALAKDRDERHENVEVFARDLTRWYYSAVSDYDAAALKPFLHKLFADDIANNRKADQAARGGVETAPPSEPDLSDRTVALPIGEGGPGGPDALHAQKTLLDDGSISQEQLRAAMKPERTVAIPLGDNPAGTGTHAQTNFTGTYTGAVPTEKKGNGLLMAALALLLLGGGGFAAWYFMDKDNKEAPGDVAVTDRVPQAELLIKVEPHTARVTVENHDMGSDGRVKGLEKGSKVRVIAEAPGFERLEEFVTISEDSTVYDIALKAVAAEVSAAVAIKGDDNAVIKVGGAVVGTGAKGARITGKEGSTVEIEVVGSDGNVVKRSVVLKKDMPLVTIPVQVKKAAVAPASATITLGLQPADAQVFADKGQVTVNPGGTQATVEGLKLNDTVTLTIKKAGYLDVIRKVTATSTSKFEQINLTPIAVVPSTPDPVVIPSTTPGAIKASGTTTSKKTTTTTKKTTKRKNTRGGEGSLVVNARPWAKITVNGKPYGTTPKTIKVNAGKHTVKLTKGGQTETKSVRITAGKTKRVSHDFTN